MKYITDIYKDYVIVIYVHVVNTCVNLLNFPICKIHLSNLKTKQYINMIMTLRRACKTLNLTMECMMEKKATLNLSKVNQLITMITKSQTKMLMDKQNLVNNQKDCTKHLNKWVDLNTKGTFWNGELPISQLKDLIRELQLMLCHLMELLAIKKTIKI
ncbi:hypothetical protein IMG5_093700 [Ichthyophthirius multifiliis]|uniref:Uncharacterized protein n=1 Tax=Ichthyophthirius multifiliis TaxID=5932 RepID=G0QRI5_ICHMU|nr:hypothetical protein IMG5_093700 [Ichthyophthirius multifiliis]EGR32172.1 hypothetical protein IMG5_093700 [Ichthyophthirius multifiliis]|eukprot:XP_004035658.1 hypothetical protein IMG5_093700 [Ichthyophthirius multifiliis]